MDLPNHNETKILPPNNKIKEGNSNSEVQTKKHIIIKNLYPPPKIEEQSYQFNSLATISTTLIKEAQIKFIPPTSQNCKENMTVLVNEYKKSKFTYLVKTIST